MRRSERYEVRQMSQVGPRIRDAHARLRPRRAGTLKGMLRDAETEAPPAPEIEPRVAELGRTLVAAMPTARRTPRAAVERRVMAAMVDDPELRAAVFRFVDVRPACTDP